MEFREPKNVNELESLLRLRYKVYSEDASLCKMISSGSVHDINFFDLKALHFGCFIAKKPVAYLRMVTDAETHFAHWIQKILSGEKISLNTTQDNFPFQTYCSDKGWSKDFIINHKGKKIGEVGKLAIDRKYRTSRGELLTGLFQAFIHYCKDQQGFDMGFGSCILPLERYYRKFGFKRAEGAIPFKYHGLPEAVMVKFDK